MSVCRVSPRKSSYPKRAGMPRGRSALGRQLGGRGRENAVTVTVTGMEIIRDVSGSKWRLESPLRCAAAAAPSLPVLPPPGVVLLPSIPGGAGRAGTAGPRGRGGAAPSPRLRCRPHSAGVLRPSDSDGTLRYTVSRKV